jgi:DNA-directed RNA polymerase subunit RPC12/RpoP
MKLKGYFKKSQNRKEKMSSTQYESKDNFPFKISVSDTVATWEKSAPETMTMTMTIKCNYCNSSCDSDVIILDCNHSFHIKCMAENDHIDSNKYPILDDCFFKDRKCITCNKQIDTSELMYIHSKYSKNIKENINKSTSGINELENAMRQIKEQMKIALEYKQKLEFSQNKSKQIIIMLNTEPN